MKTHKASKKRIKKTARGKLLVRGTGIGHFNAKAKRKKQLSKKVNVKLHIGREIKKKYNI